MKKRITSLGNTRAIDGFPIPDTAPTEDIIPNVRLITKEELVKEKREIISQCPAGSEAISIHADEVNDILMNAGEYIFMITSGSVTRWVDENLMREEYNHICEMVLDKNNLNHEELSVGDKIIITLNEDQDLDDWYNDEVLTIASLDNESQLVWVDDCPYAIQMQCIEKV